jgi:hypothetical protein
MLQANVFRVIDGVGRLAAAHLGARSGLDLAYAAAGARRPHARSRVRADSRWPPSSGLPARASARARRAFRYPRSSAAHPLHGRARVFARARRGGRVRPRVRDGRARDRAGGPLHVHVRGHSSCWRALPACGSRRRPCGCSRSSSAAFTLLQSTMVLVLLAIFGRDPWVPRALYPLASPTQSRRPRWRRSSFRLAQASTQ